MARRPKPSGRLSNGPFTFADFEAALLADGWYLEEQLTHPNYAHPTRSGKVQLDKKWTGVRKGHQTWKGVVSQSGYSDKQLLQMLNKQPAR